MNAILLTKSATPIIGPVAILLGYIMDFIFQVTNRIGFMNIGWSIIIFTIVINLIMLPLTIKQQKSSKLMSVMQPEIQAIEKKYKGKTDNETLMKKNAETRAVYEKYGTSMTGGCLPLLIQMPILFALYQVIIRIPAYVSSIRNIFESIAVPLMKEGDYINKISDLAAGARLPIDKVDYTSIDKVIDLLYKFTPSNWTEFEKIFPSLSEVLAKNVPTIESMNMFFGINLAVSPWQGIVPNIAWIIPILSGITQWYSTKLMTANQNTSNDTAVAQQMKTMNNIMPLMSVWFCFTLPAALGLYWIASAVVRIVQQFLINKQLDRIDVDTLIEQNLEKANKKREKKGLAPQTINKNAYIQAKKLEEKESKREIELEKEREATKKIIKDSTEYYNKDAKPGSLTSKANMVAKYNEKNSKRK